MALRSVEAFEPAELQSQLGSGLCSILHFIHTSFGSSFSSIFRSPPFFTMKGGGASYSSHAEDSIQQSLYESCGAKSHHLFVVRLP